MRHEGSDTEGWKQEDQEREEEEREVLRQLTHDPANFLGDGPFLPSEFQIDGNGNEGPGPVTAEFGVFYVLVPADAAEEWWADPRIQIGTCPYHHHPPGFPIDDNPCPFQTCSVLVARSPELLYRAAWSELLSASPDMPRDLLWKSLLSSWKAVKVELNLVRVAWLQDDPGLAGGEPQVRRSGRALRGKHLLAWDHLRDVVRVSFASMAVIWGDPIGLDLAARLIVFKAPFQALWKAGAIRVTPIDGAPGNVSRLPRVRLGNRLLVAKLMTWPPGRDRLRDRFHFRLTMWRANRRQVLKERHERRHIRRTSRREIIRRELALDEPNADTRARTRKALIATIREAFGLIGDFAKAVRGALFSWLIVPPSLGLLWLLHHLVA